MIRKYHDHKLQTNLWHRGEEPLNNHQTPGRQTKQSNQLSLPHQGDCKTRMDIKKRTTKHRTITDSHNGSNNKQQLRSLITYLMLYSLHLLSVVMKFHELLYFLEEVELLYY